MVLLIAMVTGKSLQREDDVVVVFERPARSPKDPIPRENSERGNNVRNGNVRFSAGSGSASVSIRRPKIYMEQSQWHDTSSGNWPGLLQRGEIWHRRLQNQLLWLLDGRIWQIRRLLLWLLNFNVILSLLFELLPYLNLSFRERERTEYLCFWMKIKLTEKPQVWDSVIGWDFEPSCGRW